MKAKQERGLSAAPLAHYEHILSAINKATTKLFTAVTLHKPGLSQTKEACECTRMSVCMCEHANERWLVRAEGLSVAILWLSTQEELPQARGTWNRA